MKKNLIFFTSAALLFAVSCNKEEANTPVENAPASTEFITVELNPLTKTELDGMNTRWVDGDAVSVFVGEEEIGTLTLVEGTTFSGEIKSGYDGVATLRYPADATSVPTVQKATEGSFANGAALLEGTTTLDALRASEAATLTNVTALLSFSSPINGDVAFTIGSTTYTVTGCEAGKTYYACVDPAASGKLSYTVGLALGEKSKASFTSEAGKKYSLGTLALKESSYSVSGDNNSWGDTNMYETAQDNFFVCYGVTFSEAGGFKVRKDSAWDDQYGLKSSGIKTKNGVYGVIPSSSAQNIGVNSGTYDIYFDRFAGQLYIMEVGKSYTEAAKEEIPINTYSLAGSFSSWGDVEMTYSGDGIWTIVRSFKKNEEWKIKSTGSWSESYNNVWLNWAYKETLDGGNLKMLNDYDLVVTFVKDMPAGGSTEPAIFLVNK